MSRFWLIFLLFVCALLPRTALGDELSDRVRDLGSDDRAKVEQAVEFIAKAPGAEPLAVLDALLVGSLRLDAQGAAFIAGEDGRLSPAFAGGADKPVEPTTTPAVDNQLRRQLEPKIASLRLSFPDPKVRLLAAEGLAKRRNDDLIPLVRQALEREKDSDVREALELALAQTDLSSDDRDRRLVRACMPSSAPPPPTSRPASSGSWKKTLPGRPRKKTTRFAARPKARSRRSSFARFGSACWATCFTDSAWAACSCSRRSGSRSRSG